MDSLNLPSTLSSIENSIMDFKWDFETKSRKGSSKKRLPFNFSLSPREDSSEATSQPKSSAHSPPKTRRSGGWASDTLKSAMRRSSSAFFEQEQLDHRMKDDEDDMPVIPTLDDYDDGEISKAPLVGHAVASYKELEIDLLKHAAFASLEDVNLRCLTTFLQNEAALSEPDVVWNRDMLFNEILTQAHQGKVD